MSNSARSLILLMVVALSVSGCRSAMGTWTLTSHGAGVGSYEVSAQLLRPLQGYPATAHSSGQADPVTVVILLVMLVERLALLASGKIAPAAATPRGVVPPDLLRGFVGRSNAPSGFGNQYIWIQGGITGVFVEK